MKNSTTLAAVALAALVSPAFAQDEIKNYKWTARNASESVDEANRDNSWSTQVTNWVDMASGIPLGRAWVDGSNAFIYNDGALVTSKISLPESVTVNNLNVNADSTYTITGNGTLEGAGDFIKEGSGTFVVGVTNNMKGVTYAKEGVIKMNNITTDAFTDSIVFLNGSIDNGGDAKNYMTLTNKIHVPEGYEGNIYTSRYCYYDCTFSGAGTLNFYSAGERVYFGHKNYGPKIENFEGNINIYKHDKGLGSGSYGMLLRGSSTYNPETEEGITDFSRNKIHLGSGTMIVSESKDYFYEIGELSCADETCEWQGYYKASNPTIYYRVGGLNTDVVFPGRIRQPEKSAGQNYKDQIGRAHV